MPLSITEIGAETYPTALAFLRRSPYRNAISLGQMTQLRASSYTLAALSNDTVVGVASIRRDLPLPRLSFVVDFPGVLPPLLAGLVEAHPHLQGQPVGVLLPLARMPLLNGMVQVEERRLLYQMVAEPETLRLSEQHAAQRLSADMRAELVALHNATAGWQSWHPDNGPAFGVVTTTGQLQAIAATCFATRDVIEIGWAMQPAAVPALQGCIGALAQLCFGLASRVYLFVEAGDDEIVTGCRHLGFWPAERFMWIVARLNLT